MGKRTKEVTTEETVSENAAVETFPMLPKTPDILSVDEVICCCNKGGILVESRGWYLG
jgi:hypothetical protein